MMSASESNLPLENLEEEKKSHSTEKQLSIRNDLKNEKDMKITPKGDTLQTEIEKTYGKIIDSLNKKDDVVKEDLITFSTQNDFVGTSLLNIPLASITSTLKSKLKKLSDDWVEFHKQLTELDKRDAIFLKKIWSAKVDPKTTEIYKKTTVVILKLTKILKDLNEEMESLCTQQYFKKIPCVNNSHALFVYRNSEVEALYFDGKGDPDKAIYFQNKGLDEELRKCKNEKDFEAYLSGCVGKLIKNGPKMENARLVLVRSLPGGEDPGRLAEYVLRNSRFISYLLQKTSSYFAWSAEKLPDNPLHRGILAALSNIAFIAPGLVARALGLLLGLSTPLLIVGVAAAVILDVTLFLRSQQRDEWAAKIERWSQILSSSRNLVIAMDDDIGPPKQPSK